MPLALAIDLPNRDGTAEGAAVDGGIALRHNSWVDGCGKLTAFTVEELTPLADALMCAHCERDIPVVGWSKAELERWLSDVSQPTGQED